MATPPDVLAANGAADTDTTVALFEEMGKPADPSPAPEADSPRTVTNVTPSAGEPTVTIKRGQRGPQKTARIEFSGDHAGLWILAWINPKRKLFRDLNSGDEERSDAALATMIIDHNFTWSEDSDEDAKEGDAHAAGDAMPRPLTYDALGDLEQDFYIEVGRGIGDAVNKLVELPKSR